MLEKYSIHTDLALEEKERFESDHVEVQGVILEEEYDKEREIRITKVKIETEKGARAIGETCRHIYYDGSTEYGRPRRGISQGNFRRTGKIYQRAHKNRKRGLCCIGGRSWKPSGDTGCIRTTCSG